jgi:PAS domain S-box-containing protein
MRILYVEDNALDAGLVSLALARAAPQIQIDLAATRTEALARLADPTRYDLVLTDLRLPDGSGLELLAHIRAANWALAVVVITGSGDEETALAALKAGADDYLAKSGNYLTHLPLVLEDALSQHRARLARRAHPLRVLYAEHSLADIDLTRRHLARHAPHIKLEVVYAVTVSLWHSLPAGDAALAAYDVILLDYRLPGWNALEILKELRQVHRMKVPIVLVTGQGDEDVALQALKLGAADYVPKTTGYLHRLPDVLEDAYHRHQLALEQAALRESEARLREAQRLGRIGNWEYDHATRAITWSDEVYELYARDPALGPPTVDEEAGYYTGEQAAQLRDCARRALADGCEFAYDLEAHLPDGQTVYLAATVRPVKEEDGQIVGLFGTVQDISGRKLAEQALRASQAALASHAAGLERRVTERTAELTAANARLEELSRLKSDFVSNVSHELRTPLANIITYLDLLDHGRPEKHDQYMATLKREAGLLQILIEDLLQLSRLDLGKDAPILSPADLNELVTLLAGDRTRLFAGHGLALRVEAADGLPPVLADQKMLIQVLTNLMTNAMNYTPAGGTVTLRTALCHQGPDGAAGSWVTCAVRDTGPGIAPEEQARLFERFYRGAAARQSRAPGTGLGLAICQEILSRHGGSITLESIVGRGSTFVMWIPLAE